MSRWPKKLLASVVDGLQPGFACRPTTADTGHPQLRPLNLIPDGSLSFDGTKSVSCSASQARGYAVEPGDVLFNNTNSPELVGKVAVFEGGGAFVFSNHITRVRVKHDKLSPKFLHRYLFKLWQEGLFRHHCTQWVNQAAINVDALGKVEIPVPPLAEQERLVRILDEADALRKLRAQADQRAATLIPALFRETFGNLLDKKPRWPLAQLGHLVELASGGTPSKERQDFWCGTTPWVSPKDMKADDLTDAQDHVSEAAFAETNLKVIPPNTVLIVVRGMILAHTVPVRICRVPAAINQDMKALLPRRTLVPEFLRWALQVMHEHLLGQVSTAGHGTKRLDTERLTAVQVPLPALPLQREFAARVAEVRAMEAAQAESRRRLDALFQSLLHRAFAGEL